MHRRPLALLALTLVASACGSAPVINDAYSPFVASHLRQANENWFSGLRTGSPALLEPLVADDATIQLPSGLSAGKASLLEELRSGRLRFDSIAGEQSKTRIHERTAIITGTATMRAQGDTLPGAGRVGYTAVYGWTGNRWMMLAWQGTRQAP